MFRIVRFRDERHGIALDSLTASLVLGIGIALIVWAVVLKHHAVQLVSILAASSLFYLLFRGKLSRDETLPMARRGANYHSLRSVAHIVFLVSLSLSIWLLWGNLYERPPLYFALILIAAASIIIDILWLSDEQTSHIVIALLKIVALAVSVYAGIYYLFPGIYGVDPWWYNEWMQETVNLGHITEGQILNNSYYLFPVFQLSGAMTQIVSGLSVHDSIFASTVVFMAISCTFVFLIGKKLGNARIGLLAALIVPLAGDFINMATAVISMSLGICFFLMILYLVFCHGRKQFSPMALIIVLSMALIFTHPIASLITLLSLVVVLLGYRLYKLVVGPAWSHGIVSLSLVMFFGIAMLFVWMQTPPYAPALLDISVTRLVISLETEAQFALAMPLPMTSIPYAIQLLDAGGYLILVCLAVVGALVYLHPRNRDSTRIGLLLTAGMLFVVPSIFRLFNLENILPGRWTVFLYLPLAVLAVQGLLNVSNLVRNNLGRLSLVMATVLTIMFMMTTSRVANTDSPLVYNGAARVGYTQSELAALDTLSYMGAGNPETDVYYGLIFPYVIGNNEYIEMSQRTNEIFLVRNYYLQHPEWNDRYATMIHMGGDHWNYTEDSVSISGYIEGRGIDQGSPIYRNGNVEAYAVPKAE